MPKASKEELLKYQEDINRYYKYRRIFLTFGLILLLGPIALLPIIIMAYMENQNSIITGDLLSTLFAISITSGIVLLILRSALFNQRIKNRKRIIQQAKDEYNIERMYAGEKDEKIGL